MEKQYKDIVTIPGSCVVTGKVSCRVLRVEGDFFLLGGEVYCQELYVDGDAYLRGNLYLNVEGVTSPSSCKVEIKGNFFCEGLVAAKGGEVRIDGSFITTSMVNLGYARMMVFDDIIVKHLNCGEIISGGNILVDWGMIDARGRIFARGDINAFEITTNHNDIYCGGLLLANRYSLGHVFENTNWEELAKVN